MGRRFLGRLAGHQSSARKDTNPPGDPVSAGLSPRRREFERRSGGGSTKSKARVGHVSGVCTAPAQGRPSLCSILIPLQSDMDTVGRGLVGGTRVGPDTTNTSPATTGAAATTMQPIDSQLTMSERCLSGQLTMVMEDPQPATGHARRWCLVSQPCYGLYLLRIQSSELVVRFIRRTWASLCPYHDRAYSLSVCLAEISRVCPAIDKKIQRARKTFITLWSTPCSTHELELVDAVDVAWCGYKPLLCSALMMLFDGRRRSDGNNILCCPFPV